MRLLSPRPLAVTLLPGLLLAYTAAARAQFNFNPTAGAAFLAGQTQGVAYGAAASRNALFNYNPAAFGFGYFPYVAGPGTNPFYGYLSGAAEVTTANAQYQLTIQQARVVREQARQAQLETRRRMFDQLRYEQANTPTAEDLRQAELQANLRRARNDPPAMDVWSGRALNDLLRAVQRGRAETGLRGPDVPLDDGALKRINVTTGTTRGSASVFRDGGRPRWPAVLQQERFARQREKIDQLAPAAVKYAADGRGDDAVVEELLQTVRDLRQQVRASARDIDLNDLVRANRFVNELFDAVRALSEPGSANFFNGKWEARGKNVGELVDEMTRGGLRFAPAASGDEAAYTALFQFLRAYDSGLAGLAAR
jgi:hypothetical protein